jgi:CBS domain-containing protein
MSNDFKSTLKWGEQRGDRFLSYLRTTTMARDLHQPCFKRLLTCNENDSVSTVLRRLSHEGILSMPVLNMGRFVGFISMFDLVTHVADLFWGANTAAWVDFFEKSDDFCTATVRDVMDSHQYGKKQYTTDPLFERNSTFHALEHLVIGNAHRSAVLNNSWDREIINICTQSMLISEIRQRLDQIGSLRYRTALQMEDFWQDVLTVRETDTAMNAFKKMSRNNVSALAIVDEEGVLTGTISEKDLRGVGASGEDFSRLFEDVKSYKQFTKQRFNRLAPTAHWSIAPTPIKGRYVTEEQTFEDVIRKMRDGNIHRVWVCSAASVRAGAPVPIKVISQGDVLKQVLKHYSIPPSGTDMDTN